MVRQRFSQLAQLQPKQLQAYNTLFDNQCKYLLYGGAAHGGKSYFLRWSAVALGIYYSQKYKIRGVPIGLFSEDYPTLKDRQVSKIKREFPSWLGELKETRDEGLIFKASEEYGGFVILLRNLDDPSKYASTEFAAELVEELTKNPVETFEDLKFRLRYPGISDVKFVGATNPGGVGHAWVKKLWIAPNPKEPDLEQDRYFFIKATARDNKYTQPGYLKQLESLPRKKRMAWLEGSWDVFEGQVFDEWSDKHVVTPFKIPEGWKRWIALDWGVNKPSSVGWYTQNFDGRTFLYRELYMNGLDFEAKFGRPLTARRMARVIIGITKKAKENYIYAVADPSMWIKDEAAPSKAEIMIKEGLKLIEGNNDRANGLARYREALSMAPDGKPWYQVFKSCYDTIRTIPALVYDKHKVEDVDTDSEDHCYDRDRYFFMSRPAKPKKPAKEEYYPIREHFKKVTLKYKERKELEYDRYEKEWAAN